MFCSEKVSGGSCKNGGYIIWLTKNSEDAPRHVVQEERFLKRYLEYARSKCAPRLSESAAELLIHEYVELREEVIPSPCCLVSPPGFSG